MLSLASAAYRADKTVVSTFTINLETLPGAVPTRAPWLGGRIFRGMGKLSPRPTPPEAAMREYAEWLKTLPGRLVFLGFPASWDFMWVYWYLVRFTGERPFREHAIDVRSYAMGMRKTSFQETTRTYLPKRWFDRQPPAHACGAG